MSLKTSYFFFRRHLKFPRPEFFKVDNLSQMLLISAFVLIVIAQVFIIGSKFNWLHVDADQLIIAEQAKWISRGFIFEPNFYGQNYLIPIDSYLGSILVLIGINPLHAVQACTVFFLYAPFVFLVAVIREQRFQLLAAVTLLVMFMPFKFLIVAQMARAFTTITSIACLALAYSLLKCERSNGKLIITLGAVFGFCLGAFTGVFLLAPALLLINKKKAAITFFSGCLFGFLVSKSTGVFYYLNPHYVVHKQMVVTFSVSDFLANLRNPSIRSPLVSLVLPSFLILVWLHFRASYLPKSARFQALLSFLGFWAVIAAMMATPKIRDFMPVSPFFSIERMFVAVPFFFLLLLVHLGVFVQKCYTAHSDWHLHCVQSIPTRKLLSLLLFIVLITRINKLNEFISSNQSEMASSPSPAQVKSIADLSQECLMLQERYLGTSDAYLYYDGPSDAPSENYLYFIGRNDTLVYGCSALMNVPIVQSVYERRTWLARFYEQNGFRKIEYHPN